MLSKGQPFLFPSEKTNKPTFPAWLHRSLVNLWWHCFPLIVRKKQLLIILYGVLLVTHRWFLYLVFVFLLGAICTREALRYDFLIAEKVNSSVCFHPTLWERPSRRRVEVRGFPTMAHFVEVWLVQALIVWILLKWWRCKALSIFSPHVEILINYIILRFKYMKKMQLTLIFIVVSWHNDLSRANNIWSYYKTPVDLYYF